MRDLDIHQICQKMVECDIAVNARFCKKCASKTNFSLRSRRVSRNAYTAKLLHALAFYTRKKAEGQARPIAGKAAKESSFHTITFRHKFEDVFVEIEVAR